MGAWHAPLPDTGHQARALVRHEGQKMVWACVKLEMGLNDMRHAEVKWGFVIEKDIVH